MSFDLERAARDIVQIRSVSSEVAKHHRGNHEVVRFLSTLCHPNLQYRIFEIRGRSRDNGLVIWPKGQAFPTARGIALHTHLDTVAPGPLSEWTKAKPFSGKIVRGELIGLGSADVKCDALCKILALSDFKKLKIPAYFIGSFSEEVGMWGAKWIRDSKIVRPKYALIGEPSEGNLAYANKGFALIQARLFFKPERYRGPAFQKSFVGKAAHSSAPHRGENALLKMLRYLSKHPEVAVGKFEGSIGMNVIPGEFKMQSSSSLIPKATIFRLVDIFRQHQAWLEKLIRSKQLKFFTPSSATSQWTQLERQGNSVFLSIDFRSLPGMDFEKFSPKFDDHDVQVSFEAPAFYQSPSSTFGKFLKPLLASQKGFITKSGANEAPFYQELGAQAFVHGPGVSYGNVHSPNESIRIKSLFEAMDFYKRVLAKFSGS